MEIFSEKENNTSHDNADILCDPCEGNNETKTAENYCVDCNEFLCGGCAKVHRKSKMSLQHIILDGLKMPKKKLVLSSDDVCSRHDGKPLEYFCNNHGGFYCAPCVTFDHRSCSLKFLTEEAKGFSDSEDYRALIARIQKVNQRIFQTKDKIQVCKEEAKSNNLKFLNEMQEFHHEIETILQAVEATAKESANATLQKDLDAFDTFSTRSEEMAIETDILTAELDNLRACEQQSRLFIAAKRIETKLDTFDTELHEIDSKARTSRYNFRGKEIMKMNVESWANYDVLEMSARPKLSDKHKKDQYEDESFSLGLSIRNPRLYSVMGAEQTEKYSYPGTCKAGIKTTVLSKLDYSYSAVDTPSTLKEMANKSGDIESLQDCNIYRTKKISSKGRILPAYTTAEKSKM